VRVPLHASTPSPRSPTPSPREPEECHGPLLASSGGAFLKSPEAFSARGGLRPEEERPGTARGTALLASLGVATPPAHRSQTPAIKHVSASQVRNPALFFLSVCFWRGAALRCTSHSSHAHRYAVPDGLLSGCWALRLPGRAFRPSGVVLHSHPTSFQSPPRTPPRQTVSQAVLRTTSVMVMTDDDYVVEQPSTRDQLHADLDDQSQHHVGSGSAADHEASLTGVRSSLKVRAMPASQRSLSASARS
jgi:hypothetical protein